MNCFNLVLMGTHDYQFEFKLDEAKALGLASRMTNLLQHPETEDLRLDKVYQFNLIELPKLESLDQDFMHEEELKSLKKRHAEIINHFKKMDEESRKNRNNVENQNERNDVETKPETNTWVDPNKDAPLEDILGSRIDLSVIDKVTDYEFVGKCFVVKTQLERDDYLKFEKIFKKFGGEWDVKKSAIVFSDDGIARMQSLFNEQENSLNHIALQYNVNEHGSINEYFKSHYIDLAHI